MSRLRVEHPELMQAKPDLYADLAMMKKEEAGSSASNKEEEARPSMVVKVNSSSSPKAGWISTNDDFEWN
jgi:hypothetical protein